jgi:hypothetical protein
MESTNVHILDIKHLSKMPNSNEAKDLLNRAANIITPMLQRRKWKIKLLTEFYPNEKGLQGLNVNRGQAIKVRLRTPDK